MLDCELCIVRIDAIPIAGASARTRMGLHADSPEGGATRRSATRPAAGGKYCCRVRRPCWAGVCLAPPTQRFRKKGRIYHLLHNIVAIREVSSSTPDERGGGGVSRASKWEGSARRRICSSSAACQFVPETHRRRAHPGMLKALAHRCYRVVHLGFLSRPRTQVSGSSPRSRK